MKIFLLSATLLTAIISKAQTPNLQIGAVTSYFGRDMFSKNEFCLGGEFAANIFIQKNISIGPALQLVKFNWENNLYIPVFATLKLNLPSKKINYFLHADAGYGIHNSRTGFKDTAGNGIFKFDFKNTGGLYLAGGGGIKLKGKVAPYVNLQYSLYGFKFETRSVNLTESEKYAHTERSVAAGITITAGIFIDKGHK
jgi:hypothetical protein